MWVLLTSLKDVGSHHHVGGARPTCGSDVTRQLFNAPLTAMLLSDEIAAVLKGAWDSLEDVQKKRIRGINLLSKTNGFPKPLFVRDMLYAVISNALGDVSNEALDALKALKALAALGTLSTPNTKTRDAWVELTLLLTAPFMTKLCGIVEGMDASVYRKNPSSISISISKDHRYYEIVAVRDPGVIHDRIVVDGTEYALCAGVVSFSRNDKTRGQLSCYTCGGAQYVYNSNDAADAGFHAQTNWKSSDFSGLDAQKKQRVFPKAQGYKFDVLFYIRKH